MDFARVGAASTNQGGEEALDTQHVLTTTTRFPVTQVSCPSSSNIHHHANIQDQLCVTAELPGHVFLWGERDPVGLRWDTSIHWVFSCSRHMCWPIFCSHPDSSFKAETFPRMLLGELVR